MIVARSGLWWCGRRSGCALPTSPYPPGLSWPFRPDGAKTERKAPPNAAGRAGARGRPARTPAPGASALSEHPPKPDPDRGLCRPVVTGERRLFSLKITQSPWRHWLGWCWKYPLPTDEGRGALPVPDRGAPAAVGPHTISRAVISIPLRRGVAVIGASASPGAPTSARDGCCLRARHRDSRIPRDVVGRLSLLAVVSSCGCGL
jgi:hypothetical protein